MSIPQGKGSSLWSHRGSVTELSLVSHTLSIHWFHWRNNRSVSYYPSHYIQRMTSQIWMMSQIRNGGQSWIRLKSSTLKMTKQFFCTNNKVTLFILGQRQLRPPEVVWNIGHLLLVVWTHVYCECIINYNIQPRLTLLKVCWNVNRRKL